MSDYRIQIGSGDQIVISTKKKPDKRRTNLLLKRVIKAIEKY